MPPTTPELAAREPRQYGKLEAPIKAGWLTKRAKSGKALLYISDYNDNVIDIFDLGNHHVLVGQITDGIDGPTGLATDKAGNLYFANDPYAASPPYTVTVYAPGSLKPSTTYKNGLSFPIGLAVSGDGRLYVANSDSDSIAEYRKGSTKVYKTVSQPSLAKRRKNSTPGHPKFTLTRTRIDAAYLLRLPGVMLSMALFQWGARRLSRRCASHFVTGGSGKVDIARDASRAPRRKSLAQLYFLVTATLLDSVRGSARISSCISFELSGEIAASRRAAPQRSRARATGAYGSKARTVGLKPAVSSFRNFPFFEL